MKENVKQLSLEELKGVLVSWKEPAFRAGQIFSWIYQKGAKDFAGMSNLPASLRRRLEDEFYLSGLELASFKESLDGTKKFLFKLPDQKFIEAVNIPAPNRVTGCISSQAGCKFACAFCASGALGFKRNLSSAEILDQVAYLKSDSPRALTHIVFMGTGEPLDNYDNVLKAVRTMNSDWSFNIGARRITVSTCGLVPAIARLAEEGLQVELSVSLHAADDNVRNALMPVNKRYPIKELIDSCRKYIDRTNRQITFEYILAEGVNSDLPNAVNLSKILKGLNCKVNLIPINPQKEEGFAPPSLRDILFFRDALIKSGVTVTLRRPRGQDIEAACGQLRLKYEKD